MAESSSLPPFLVVASNDVNEELNALADSPVYWPERRYGWGTAEAFNPEHSDLLALRALLLKEALEDITRGKRLRYEEWRRRQLSRPRLGRKLFGLVLSVLPMAVCLHVGRMGLKVDDLKAMAITTAKTVAETAQLVHAEVSKRLPKKKAPAPVALPPPPPPKKGPFGW